MRDNTFFQWLLVTAIICLVNCFQVPLVCSAATDIFWRHTSTGEVGVWQMDGNRYIQYVSIGTVGDLNWNLVGIGDFNRDGKTDILWRHSGTGEVGIWLTSATRSAQYVYVGIVSDMSWEVIETADFNKDGKTDILWRHKGSGDVGVWLMNDTRYTQYVHIGAVSDLSWKIIGVGNLQPINLTLGGTWSGSFVSSVTGSDYVTLYLQQDGLTITGIYETDSEGLGTISGSVTGNEARFTMTVTTQGCSGSFSGSGIINVPQTGMPTMSFSYNGSSTCGGQENGFGTLRKQ